MTIVAAPTPSAAAVNPAALYTLLKEILSTGWADTWSDLGPHLTCSEAETLAGFMTAAGEPHLAHGLMLGHGYGDEPFDLDEGSGDQHGQGSPWQGMTEDQQLACLAELTDLAG